MVKRVDPIHVVHVAIAIVVNAVGRFVIAVGIKARLISSGVASGFTDHRSAAAPVTCAQAAEVLPKLLTYFDPLEVVVIPTSSAPGAAKSTVLRPKFELEVIPSLESEAATEMT